MPSNPRSTNRPEPTSRAAIAGLALVLLAAGGETAQSAPRVECAAGAVEVEARHVPLGDLLRRLARQCRLDLRLQAPLPEPVDVAFRAISLRHAVERILEGRGHAYGFSRPAMGDGDRRSTLWVFNDRSRVDGRAPDRVGRVTHEADPRLAPLLASLALPDAGRRQDTVFRLAHVGGEVAAGAIAERALFDEDATVREEALAGLGQIGGSTQVPALERALLDPERRVRQAAVWALAEIGGDAAARALATVLADDDPSLRAEAVYALGEIGGESAAYLLESALADERASVRDTAGEVLENLAESSARHIAGGVESR